jgi:hypothetical protein
MLVKKIDAELFWPPVAAACTCARAVIDAALVERAFAD